MGAHASRPPSNSLITVPAATVGLLGSSRSRLPHQCANGEVHHRQVRLSGEPSNRATVRWVQFHNDAPYNSGGGINTLERATNFLDAMDSLPASGSRASASKLASFVCECPIVIGARSTPIRAPGLRLRLPKRGGFGAPVSGTDRATPVSTSNRGIRRSWTTSPTCAPHTATSSASTGSTSTTSARRRTVLRVPDVTGVLDAKNSVNAFSYDHDAAHRRPGVQHVDEHLQHVRAGRWQLAPSLLKLLYSVATASTSIPGLAGAPLTRTGLQHRSATTSARAPASLSRSTVVRASTGIMYDQAILGGYEQALRLSGSRVPVVYVQPDHRGAPAIQTGRRRPARSRSNRRGRSIGLPGRAHVAIECAARALVRQQYVGVSESHVCQGRPVACGH